MSDEKDSVSDVAKEEATPATDEWTEAKWLALPKKEQNRILVCMHTMRIIDRLCALEGGTFKYTRDPNDPLGVIVS